MATLAQLEAESWWDREIVTDELDWLGEELCRRSGQPPVAFGSKGNVAHLRGSHRSQEWIKNSAYATSRTYTVQSGLTTLQARYIGGADWTPGEWGTAENRRRMIAMSQRIISAMKAGELPEVREYFGTLDGKTVTGWSNVTHAPVSADDSHLDHGHIGLFRQHANDRALMERLADLITGDDMTTAAELVAADIDPTAGTYTLGGAVYVAMNRTGTIMNSQMPQALAALTRIEVAEAVQTAAIKALSEAGGVDAAPILTAIDQVKAELGAKLGDAVARIAELDAEGDTLRAKLAAAYAAGAAS